MRFRVPLVTRDGDVTTLVLRVAAWGILWLNRPHAQTQWALPHMTTYSRWGRHQRRSGRQLSTSDRSGRICGGTNKEKFLYVVTQLLACGAQSIYCLFCDVESDR